MAVTVASYCFEKICPSGITTGVARFRANLPTIPGSTGNAKKFSFLLLKVAEIVAAAMRLMCKNKGIGVVLLECTWLSPHAFAALGAVKLPVLGFTTLTNQVYLG